MKNRAYNVFLLIWMVVYLTGCITSHYIPNPTVFEFGEKIEFVSKDSITLINDQPFSEDINLFGMVYGNFQKWTDVAIRVTNNELSKRGMTVVDNAKKKLKLSITDVKLKNKVVYVTGLTFLRVETGNGYVSTYVGKAGSGLAARRAINRSFIRAIGAMLRDPFIVKYLIE